MRSDVVLPAPFGPEVAVDVAGLDGEVDVVDGGQLAVALDEAARLDRPAPLIASPRAAVSAACGGTEPATT